MNDVESSQMSYLCNALAACPNGYDRLLSIAEEFELCPHALAELRREIEGWEADHGTPTKDAMLNVATALQHSRDSDVRQTGHVLQWYVDNLY
jgi:hypothetical protein